MNQVHLLISGRVQGVWFRRFVCQTALADGLSGWVKNNLDGTVEVMARGENKSLTKLMSACQKGPFFARVDDVCYLPVSDEDLPIEDGIFKKV